MKTRLIPQCSISRSTTSRGLSSMMASLRRCVTGNLQPLVRRYTRLLQNGYTQDVGNFSWQPILYQRTNFYKQLIRTVTKIPEDYRLVYEGPLSNSVKYVKLFSLTTCAASLIGSPILVFFGKASVPLVGKIALAGTVALIGSSTTFILHWLTKVYVHRMHFNPMERKFAIETYSLLARKKLTLLPVKDIRIPHDEGAFSTFEGHGKKYFLHVEVREAQQVLNYVREYQVAMDTANI